MFQFHIKDKDKEIEFSADHELNEIEQSTLSKLLSWFSGSHSEEDLDLKRFKEGYQAFVSPKKGLHHPHSEFEEPEMEAPSVTGDKSIRYGEGDTPLYQTYYVCPKCGNKGRRYLPMNQNTIFCHKCNHAMKKNPSTRRGFPDRDQFGNFFIAGDFRVESLTKVSEQQE